MRKWLGLFAVCCLLLAGCGKPLPPDKTVYAGEWRAPTMSLLITRDGNVMYKRVKGGATTSVNGPLKSFEGANLVVGIGPMKTTFVVSRPPYQEQGDWKMVVDGVELTRMRQGD